MEGRLSLGLTERAGKKQDEQDDQEDTGQTDARTPIRPLAVTETTAKGENDKDH